MDIDLASLQKFWRENLLLSSFVIYKFRLIEDGKQMLIFAQLPLSCADDHLLYLWILFSDHWIEFSYACAKKRQISRLLT